MRRSIRPAFKRVLFWSVFVYVLILVAMWRFRIIQKMQAPWRESLQQTEENPTPEKDTEERADPAASELTGDETLEHLAERSEAWSAADPEVRREALRQRMDRVAAMEPERVNAIADHLLQITGPEAIDTQEVPFEDLDLDSAVPVDMWRDEDGKIVTRLLDDSGNISEMRTDADEMTREERQALEAFEWMDQIPALEKLRPLWVPLLREQTP